MQSYQEMTKEELLAEKKSLEAEYKKFQQRGLKLDMSRGKPSQEQLDLSMGMMDVLASVSYTHLFCMFFPENLSPYCAKAWTYF